MAFMPTVLTPKLSLRRAITALNVSTLAAFLRGVARVNEPHVHTSGYGFVSNEYLELVEAPSSKGIFNRPLILRIDNSERSNQTV
jgi:hypothetical protein